MWRFRLFGFPVTVHWMFWIVSLLLSGRLAASGDALKGLAIWVGVVFVSILWHELGHAFAFRRYGRHASITLYTLGGYAQAQGGLTRKQDIIVSLAGPAFGFAFGFLVYGIEQLFPSITAGSGSLQLLVEDLLFVNIFWSLINLLPVLPLDGGRVCRQLVAGKGAGLAFKIGLVTGVVVAVVALINGRTFLAVMFGLLAYQNWQSLQQLYGRPTGGDPLSGLGGPGGSGRGY